MLDSFEDTTNWTHTVTVYDAATGQLVGSQEVGNVFVPRGWGFFFLHGPCTHDPQNTNGWSQPEASHIPATVDPVRVHTGLQGYKSFGFYRIVDCGLTRRITGLKPGQKVKVKAFAHAWTGSSDDPRTSEGVGTAAFAMPVGTVGLSDAVRNATFQIGVATSSLDAGPYAASVKWGVGWHIYNRYALLEAEAIAEGDAVQIYLRGSTLWPYKHNDLYWDDVEVTVEDAEPEPTECRGLPREQYARVVNVVPGNASEERFLEISEIAWDRGRQTVGCSHDDAGLGDLSDKTAVLWDIAHADRQLYLDWYARWYPGTVVHFDGDGGEIEPEPDDEPYLYPLRSGNAIGLHSSYVGANSWSYIDQGKPNVQKFFSAGDAYRAGMRAPGMVSIWRKFVDAIPQSTPEGEARWYIDQYSAEIDAAAKALGLTVYDLLQGITGIESANEVIGSGCPDGIKRAVEMDVAFAELCWQRFGGMLAPVLLNVAVGNPLESEVELLLPAAEAAEDYQGFIGYHAYWAANQVFSFLASGWPYHAGRWMEWDKVFTAAGCYPRYVSTEGGICYAADGWAFDPGKGWRATGWPFSRYLVDLAEYNRRVGEWNAEHGNRCAGLTVFCAYQWNWDSFLLGDGEIQALIKWAATL